MKALYGIKHEQIFDFTQFSFDSWRTRIQLWFIKMFFIIGLVILALYFYIRQYLDAKFSYFDKRQVKCVKPTFKGFIEIQKTSFPDLILKSYNNLKGEK